MIRLSTQEVEAIKSSVFLFDPEALIYLFGSRVDPKKRGGDIDLIVLSKKLKPIDKIKIEMKLFEKIDEQKVDIIIAKDDSQPFVKVALKAGVKL